MYVIEILGTEFAIEDQRVAGHLWEVLGRPPTRLANHGSMTAAQVRLSVWRNAAPRDVARFFLERRVAAAQVVPS